MHTMIEIIPIGPNGNLYQICDGERFGRLDMENGPASWQVAKRGLQQWPEVMDVLADWLEQDGVLVGSPHAAQICWTEVLRRISRAA
jgi:hypothetical protein